MLSASFAPGPCSSKPLCSGTLARGGVLHHHIDACSIKLESPTMSLVPHQRAPPPGRAHCRGVKPNPYSAQLSCRWVEEQFREHPEGFWSPGLQDYLNFEDRIRKDFAQELQELEAGDDVPAHMLLNGKGLIPTCCAAASSCLCSISHNSGGRGAAHS